MTSDERKAYMKDWRAKRRAHIWEYRQRIKDRIAGYRKKSYDPVKEREKNRRYRKNNPEKIREIKRRWRINNLDKHNDAKARWRKRNPVKVLSSAIKGLNNDHSRTLTYTFLSLDQCPWYEKNIINDQLSPLEILLEKEENALQGY